MEVMEIEVRLFVPKPKSDYEAFHSGGRYINFDYLGFFNLLTAYDEVTHHHNECPLVPMTSHREVFTIFAYVYTCSFLLF